MEQEVALKKPKSRILALDILRGITVAGMIMVNNPGSWGAIYAPLEHASWLGLTPTDLVFPFFMFIMGISTYISMRKYKFEYSHATLVKIVRRTIVIFLIGMAIAWFSRLCYGLYAPTPPCLSASASSMPPTVSPPCVYLAFAASGTLLLCLRHCRHSREAQVYSVDYCRNIGGLRSVAAHVQRT